MSKINYEDYLEEDPFHPCLYCGSLNHGVDEEGMPICLDCGEILEAPEASRPFRGKKTQRKVKESDWE